MLITDDNWDDVANFRKMNLCQCELCNREFASADLCARRLQYGQEVDDKYMLIVCHKCDRRMSQAEHTEISLLTDLHRKTYDDFTRIQAESLFEDPNKLTDILQLLSDYVKTRCNIVADAIVMAVDLNRTRKRPMIDMLYRHPNVIFEHELRHLCQHYGMWDPNLENRVVKAKLEELRMKKKQKSKEKQK